MFKLSGSPGAAWATTVRVCVCINATVSQSALLPLTVQHVLFGHNVIFSYSHIDTTTAPTVGMQSWNIAEMFSLSRLLDFLH